MISIEDADTFFKTLQQSVESIEEFSRPHPLFHRSRNCEPETLYSRPPLPDSIVDFATLNWPTFDHLIWPTPGN